MSFEKLENILIVIIALFSIGILIWKVHHEFQLDNEIIAKSEEYVTFDHCTEVHGKYYCK